MAIKCFFYYCDNMRLSFHCETLNSPEPRSLFNKMLSGKKAGYRRVCMEWSHLCKKKLNVSIHWGHLEQSFQEGRGERTGGEKEQEGRKVREKKREKETKPNSHCFAHFTTVLFESFQWEYNHTPFIDLKIIIRDLPGGPVAKTPRPQCRGPRFNPSSGN